MAPSLSVLFIFTWFRVSGVVRFMVLDFYDSFELKYKIIKDSIRVQDADALDSGSS